MELALFAHASLSTSDWILFRIQRRLFLLVYAPLLELVRDSDLWPRHSLTIPLLQVPAICKDSELCGVDLGTAKRQVSPRVQSTIQNILLRGGHMGLLNFSLFVLVT